MRVGNLLGVSKQNEIIVLSIFGILCTIFDASLLDFNTNLYKIWDIRMDPARFSERIELYMKYLLSGVVIVRTFTVHLYLGCYIILLYPAFFEDRPGLLLPWLTVNTIKCLLMGFLSFSAGIYTCSMYRFMQPTCYEFLLTQLLDHTPSVYMFWLVLGYYHDLKLMLQVQRYIDPVELTQRRRKTRLLHEVQEIKPLNIHDDRKLISVSTIENVLVHLNSGMNKGTSRSLDTLLAQMKVDEATHAIMGSQYEMADNGASSSPNCQKKLHRSMSALLEPKEPKELPSPPNLSHKTSDVMLHPSETELRSVFPEAWTQAKSQEDTLEEPKSTLLQIETTRSEEKFEIPDRGTDKPVCATPPQEQTEFDTDLNTKHEDDSRHEFDTDLNTKNEYVSSHEFDTNFNTKHEDDSRHEFDTDLNTKNEDDSRHEFDTDVNTKHDDDSNYAFDTDLNTKDEDDSRHEFDTDFNTKHEDDSNYEFDTDLNTKDEDDSSHEDAETLDAIGIIQLPVDVKPERNETNRQSIDKPVRREPTVRINPIGTTNAKTTAASGYTSRIDSIPYQRRYSGSEPPVVPTKRAVSRIEPILGTSRAFEDKRKSFSSAPRSSISAKIEPIIGTNREDFSTRRKFDAGTSKVTIGNTDSNVTNKKLTSDKSKTERDDLGTKRKSTTIKSDPSKIIPIIGTERDLGTRRKSGVGLKGEKDDKRKDDKRDDDKRKDDKSKSKVALRRDTKLELYIGPKLDTIIGTQSGGKREKETKREGVILTVASDTERPGSSKKQNNQKENPKQTPILEPIDNSKGKFPTKKEPPKPDDTHIQHVTVVGEVNFPHTPSGTLTNQKLQLENQRTSYLLSPYSFKYRKFRSEEQLLATGHTIEKLGLQVINAPTVEEVKKPTHDEHQRIIVERDPEYEQPSTSSNVTNLSTKQSIKITEPKSMTAWKESVRKHADSSVQAELSEDPKEETNKSVEGKRKKSRRTTLTQPSQNKETPTSGSMIYQMEGGNRQKQNEHTIEEFYKNRASYVTSFKEDGYTSAFLDEISKEKFKRDSDDD